MLERWCGWGMGEGSKMTVRSKSGVYMCACWGSMLGDGHLKSQRREVVQGPHMGVFSSSWLGVERFIQQWVITCILTQFLYFMFERGSFPNKIFEGTDHPLVKKYLLSSLVLFKPAQWYSISRRFDCPLKSWAAAGRICDGADDTNQISLNYSENLFCVKIHQVNGERKWMDFSFCSCWFFFLLYSSFHCLNCIKRKYFCLSVLTRDWNMWRNCCLCYIFNNSFCSLVVKMKTRQPRNLSWKGTPGNTRSFINGGFFFFYVMIKESLKYSIHFDCYGNAHGIILHLQWM